MDNRPFDEKDNDAEIEAQVHARKTGTEHGKVPNPDPSNVQSAFWSNPIVRIALFCFCVFVVAFLGRCVLSLVYAKPLFLNPQDWGNYAYWLVFLPLTGAIGTLTALCLMKRREGWALLESTGFGSQGAGRAILIGLLISLVISGATLVLTAFTTDRSYLMRSKPPHFFALLLGYSLIGSIFRVIANETIFRGFILQELEKRWGTLVGLVVSSILFSVYVNWYQINPQYFHDYYSTGWVFSLTTGVLWSLVSGVLLASAYLYTRSLWAPIIFSLSAGLAGEGISFLFHRPPNYAVVHFVEIAVAAGLIVMTIRKGQWKPGPGPREIARAAYAGIVKVVEMTDPGQQLDS